MHINWRNAHALGNCLWRSTLALTIQEYEKARHLLTSHNLSYKYLFIMSQSPFSLHQSHIACLIFNCTNMKWSKTCKAAKILKSKLDSGEITADSLPKQEWESEEEFQKFPLHIFRQHFNKGKAEAGIYVKSKLLTIVYINMIVHLIVSCFFSEKDEGGSCFDEEDDDALPNPKRPKQEPEDSPGAGQEIICNDELYWRPIYSRSVWRNQDMTDCVTVAVLLPSGVTETMAFVESDGCTLVVKAIWPEMLTNLDKLHAKWLQAKDPNRLPPFHPKLMGFKQHYKTLRKRSSDKLISVARIPLPFQVHQKLDVIYKLGDSSGSRIIYIELQAFCDNYNDASNPGDFEVFD